MFGKKKILSLISLVLVLAISLLGCTNSAVKDNVSETSYELEKFGPQNVDVPYNPVNFTAKVESYKVTQDLSNIKNVDKFGEFSAEQLDLIVKNNFVVNPTKEEQLFYLYETNEYLEIPSFITTDSVLHTYHIFYDYYLRTLENEKLLEILVELTDKMLKTSIDVYNDISNEEVKSAQLKNIAFFATAQLCLKKSLTDDFPKEALEMANKEFDLINAHEGFIQSAIFPYELDYSQFVPRGHYTRSEDLSLYFKTMMWYGQALFTLYIEKDGIKERNVEQTIVSYKRCCL